MSETGAALYEALSPAFTAEDDGTLEDFCEALVDGTLEAIHLIVSERNGVPGWRVVFDPDEAPAEYLPYLAQFVGVELEPDLTEEEQRDKIRLPEGFLRGTAEAITQAVQRTLTGSQHIVFEERYGGSAYALAIRTQASETPSEAVTLAAILTQKPVGILLTYDSIAGETYIEVEAAHADYDELEAENADYSEVLLLG